jgi:hypothetical protein
VKEVAMGAVRTMRLRRLEGERRLRVAKRTASHMERLMVEWQREGLRLGSCIRELEAALQDPEGTIQRGLNERYVRDMREREMEHHASWDAEVVVHKMAAARWMRGCVLELVTDEGLRGAIEALPLVPEDV